MQQITRGDYLKDLITIHVENHLPQALDELYSQFVFQCGEIQRFLTPAEVINISFNEQESQKLTNFNVCYLAGITVDGHKETFNGSISFNTRGEVVLYEPPVSQSTTAVNSNGVSGTFSNCSQSAVVAHFSINYVPSKLSELENDTDFQSGEEVAASIAEHNESEGAHPYIQSVIQSGTEATLAIIGDLDNLTTSDKSSIVNAINSEVSAREQSVSSAISTTEAYTDSVLQSATTAINTTIGDLSSLDTSVKSSVTSAINSEVSARQSADNNLQGQIDALAAASDVTDIVGTYAELQAYDTQHLNDNDIIKVLSDSTHDNQPSYYRFNKTAGTFSYIGSESAAYTKAQSDSIFVTKTTTINNKPLSSDITLTYSDVDALSETYATTIASNTSAIATNTSAISTINGKIPTDASTTNKLVTVSSIADLANQDLSNLTTNGEARLHALKSYKDEGELLTDAEGLEDVTAYSHSTFDSSKFTVVGSPTITDDGIASGFSTSNYLTINSSTLGNSLHNANSWKIIQEFTYNGGQDWAVLFDCTNHTGISSFIVPSENNSFAYALSSDGINEDISNAYPLRFTGLILGNTYKSVLEFTGTQYTHTLYNSDGTQFSEAKTVTSSTKVINSAGYYVGGRNNFYGSIDLKQFSITIDGVEVFSGNKTGIDTIKPDDYTVVGTPTISADGILTFTGSANGRIETPSINFASAKSWKLVTKYYAGALVNDIQVPFGLATQTGMQIVQFANSTGYSLNAAATIFGADAGIAGISLNSNSWYDIEIGQSEDKTFYIKYKPVTSDAYTTESNGSATQIMNYNGVLSFGGYNSVNNLKQGGFDLNTIKVYIDGDLVYQPCLKIPYTESKTGSKIVSSPYRDRVSDMAEQFGYAPYYTLQDEAKGNYTVVGSPTISSDYVASGFGDSDYIDTVLLPYDKLNYCITLKNYKYLGGQSFIFGNRNTANNQSLNVIFNDNRILLFASSTGISWDIANAVVSPIVVPGITYDISFVRENGSAYKVIVYDHSSNTTTTAITVTTNSNLFNSQNLIAIGAGSWQAYTGSIDLKEFKVYVDNELAYEAVTEPNFTLPQGELYGNIQQTLRSSTVSGINQNYLYSNRMQIQTGSCTSGVEVTLPKPFSDSNYALTVPYSAKSATAFTPTATGDWIAIGLGNL